jgi:hypothetical protein
MLLWPGLGWCPGADQPIGPRWWSRRAGGSCGEVVDKLVRLFPSHIERVMHSMVTKMANKQILDGRTHLH